MRVDKKQDIGHFVCIVSIFVGLMLARTITQELIVVLLPACALIGLLRISLFVQRLTGCAVIGLILDSVTGVIIGIFIMFAVHATASSHIPVAVKKIAQSYFIMGLIMYFIGAIVGLLFTRVRLRH